MAKFEFESEEEMVDFDGIPVPKSVHDKLLDTGRTQTTASIRRKAQDKFSGDLGDDFDWTKVKPGQIIDSLSDAFAGKSKTIEELKKTQSQVVEVDPKKKPDENQADELRLLKDDMAAQAQKHEKDLFNEQARNLTSQSRNEISRILIGAGLNEDQHEFVETMIDKCFDIKVEGDAVIFNQKGVETDYYVNGKIGDSKDIADFIQKKYIGSFSKVAPGGGTRPTIGGTTSQSAYDPIKGGRLRQEEAAIWNK